jgi:hypothetical protein
MILDDEAGNLDRVLRWHELQELILLKNPKNASTRLSMNGKSPKILTTPPFVLRFSKDERRVFQQNQEF